MRSTNESKGIAHSETGTIMVLVMIITAMIAAMGIAYVATSTSQEQMVSSSINNVSYEEAALAGFEISKAFLISKYSSGWDTELANSVANSGTYTANSTSIQDGVTSGYTTGYTTWFQWNRNIDYYGNTYLAKIENNSDGGSATDDRDGVLKLTVEAWGNGNDPNDRSQQILLEGMVNYKTATTPFAPTAAVVVGGSLKVFGSVSIAGTNGSIQANGNVVLQGAASVSADVTAVGSITGGNIGGTSTPNADEVAIPEIIPADYEYLADKIFKTDGKVYNQSNVLVATPAGWTYSGGTWSTSGTACYGVYYFDGSNVSIGGSGGSATNPMTITMIATGSINVTGSPSLMPNPNGGGIALMAGGDLRMRGAGGNKYGNGLYAAHEQISMIGTPTVNGCVLAEDAEDVCTLVSSNSDIYGEIEELGGNTSVIYNGGLTTVLTTTDGNPYIKVLGFKKRIKERY